MQKGYLLPLSSIAAGAVDAHGGAKPELPAIRVPPSPPVDARLGFVSVATTSNLLCQPRLDSPPPLTPGSPRKELGLGFGRRDEGRRMDGGASVRQRRGKNEEECERRTGAAEKDRACCSALSSRTGVIRAHTEIRHLQVGLATL